MARLVLTNLTKVYPEKSGPGVTAVKNIDLVIEDREFMVLVGPSGCGKSTVLRMIAGLEEITEGEITIDGKVVNNIPPKDRDIAMVFQNYALYPHMSVYDNLAFGLKLRKVPKPEIALRVRDAAAMLGLDPYLARKPKALSGGQRQRVALGRAIVRKPKVFLFDEPLSNLDAKMRASTRAEIARLHDRLESTMVYVTHDQVEAMTLGHRICVMKDGRIMQVADPVTLYNRPENMFVAGFIGSPPMNFFRGRFREAGGALRFIADEQQVHGWTLNEAAAKTFPGASLSGRPLVLGVRPEDMTAAPDPAQPQLSITGQLELIEYLGAEICLHVNAADVPFIARIHATQQPNPGDRLPFTANLGNLHFFDPETGNALTPHR